MEQHDITGSNGRNDELCCPLRWLLQPVIADCAPHHDLETRGADHCVATKSLFAIGWAEPMNRCGDRVFETPPTVARAVQDRPRGQRGQTRVVDAVEADLVASVAYAAGQCGIPLGSAAEEEEARESPARRKDLQDWLRPGRVRSVVERERDEWLLGLGSDHAPDRREYSLDGRTQSAFRAPPKVIRTSVNAGVLVLKHIDYRPAIASERR